MRVKLADAVEWTGGRVHGVLPGDPVSSFGFDTRTLPAGALFFAIRGETNDGHDYVAAALEKGAAAAVVERVVDCPLPQIQVDDSLRALQVMAKNARRAWPGTVVGITGSAGKTTTKDAIAAVLAVALRTGKTSGNFNNHLGVPLSILHLPDDAEVAVLEIGMNHAGEIRELSRIARPDHGVVTNVGSAHMENFDSIEGVAKAKRELIEALPPAGTAILNADDPRVAGFASFHPGRTITYGMSARATVRGENARFSAEGCSVHVAGAGAFECSLPGRAGVLTALSALATAKAFGIPLELAREPLRTLKPAPMRFERSIHGGVVVWNDCYNSNPEAAQMMLDLLVNTPAQRHIAVLGEMLELGRWSKDLHRDVGRYAAECGISVLIGIRGAALHLVEAARDAGIEAGAASFCDEPVAAGRYLKSVVRSGDAVLFKGSRGTRVELALQEFLR